MFTVCSAMTNRLTFVTNVNDDSSIKDDINGTVINDMDIDSDYDGNADCKVFTCHNGCFWEFLSNKYFRQISILSNN